MSHLIRLLKGIRSFCGYLFWPQWGRKEMNVLHNNFDSGIKVSFIVNSVYNSRTYILTNGGNEAWLVDCGDVPAVIDKLKSLSHEVASIKGVLLTHVHYDHIYGLSRLIDFFPEVIVYTNDYGKNALASSKLNLSKYHEDPIEFTSENVVVCTEGVDIELFEGVRAKVYYTPGHNPSCITYEIDNYLFTGDAFIPEVKVVTNLPGGDKKLASQTIERIVRMSKGKIVCPGHETTSNH